MNNDLLEKIRDSAISLRNDILRDDYDIKSVLANLLTFEIELINDELNKRKVPTTPYT